MKQQQTIAAEYKNKHNGAFMYGVRENNSVVNTKPHTWN